MKIKQLFTTVIVVAILSGFSQFANAGNSPNNHNPNTNNPNINGRNNNDHNNNGHKRSSTQVPFDGGLSLLLAAGIGIGIKKGYDKRKKQPKTSLQDKG